MTKTEKPNRPPFLRPKIYHLKHHLFSLKNLGILIAVVLATYFVVSSITSMQKNYDLSRKVVDLERTAKTLELQNDLLRFDQNFYKSAEYQELAARSKLGLVRPGETVLVLPHSEESPTNPLDTSQSESKEPRSNLNQWLDFIFGRRAS